MKQLRGSYGWTSLLKKIICVYMYTVEKDNTCTYVRGMRGMLSSANRIQMYRINFLFILHPEASSNLWSPHHD